MTAENVCPIDGRPLERPATGRPPTFCSVACRRVAEAETRRGDRRLAVLEAQRDELDVSIASGSYAPLRRTDVKQRAAIDALIEAGVERQRQVYAWLSPDPDQPAEGRDR